MVNPPKEPVMLAKIHTSEEDESTTRIIRDPRNYSNRQA